MPIHTRKPAQSYIELVGLPYGGELVAAAGCVAWRGVAAWRGHCQPSGYLACFLVVGAGCSCGVVSWLVGCCGCVAVAVQAVAVCATTGRAGFLTPTLLCYCLCGVSMFSEA